MFCCTILEAGHLTKTKHSFNKPRSGEANEIKPQNPNLGRAKDGRVVEYLCLGSTCDFVKARAQFTVEAYVELELYRLELYRMILDAMCASEGSEY